MKLGELLMEMGAIDARQLHEALSAQLIHGGHLGTCLIERGFVTEEQLGEALTEAVGVPCATKERFENIPRYVIESVPKRLVEKHQAVPFRLNKSTIDVAMVQPTDLHAVDELTFASGRKVRAWVAPEVRILQALDRYYDIARRMRYVALARQLDDLDGRGVTDPQVVALDELATAATMAAIGKATAERSTATRRSEPGATAEKATAPTTARSGTADGAAKQATAASSVTKAPGTVAPDAVTTTAAAIVDRAQQATLDGERAAAAAGGPDPLEPLATLLCRVAGETTLGEILIENAAPDVSRSILFMVHAGAATPWNWRGIDLDCDVAASMRFPISGEPVFRLLLGESAYRGPLPPDGRYLGFFKTLGIEPPREMVLVPCYADDRLVALLYFDDGDGNGIEQDTATFVRLARKVGLALNLIRIKQQIRTV